MKNYGWMHWFREINVAHAYNQAIAMDIIRQTKEKYYDMFIQLEKKIEQDWL